MLTSLQIGKNGRLGNQMFQYAALVGASFIRGYDWKLQDTEEVDLRKVFKMKNAKVLDPSETSSLKFRYEEPFFNYSPGIFIVDDNTDLFGYFQSPMYFADSFEYLMEDYQFLDPIRSEANKKMSILHQGKPVCSLHVRRGDYLTKQDYHPPCSVEYYKQAMQMVRNATNNNVTFLCFGDDLQWVEENLKDSDCVIVSGNTPEIDLCLMSMCNIHIIANSSFSWWGAMLGNFRNVIAPAQWFGPAGPKQWNTIYVNGWSII